MGNACSPCRCSPGCRSTTRRRSLRPCRRSSMADGPVNDAPYRLLNDVQFGDGVVVQAFTNLYGCAIGDETRVGPFVEIQRAATAGARSQAQSHTYLRTRLETDDKQFEHLRGLP